MSLCRAPVQPKFVRKVPKRNIPRWLFNTIQRRLKDVIRIRRDLRKARTLKEEKRQERELKKAHIECGYAQHWVMLT
jgi:hypothetical protein